MSLLSCQGISLSMGQRSVLREIALNLGVGECLGVIGPSGEGKTTLLKVLAGLLAADTGSLTYRGSVVSGQSLRRRRELMKDVSMTFQRGGLFDSMSVEENLFFALRESRTAQENNVSLRMKSALDEVGLGGAEKKQISELSGGMQKRLVLARALLLKPRVLLVDDPTAGLDPVTSRTIVNLLADLRKKYEVSLVWVSSELPLLLPAVDRVLFLYQGKALFLGSVADLRQSEHPVIRQFIRGDLEGPLTEMFQ